MFVKKIVLAGTVLSFLCSFCLVKASEIKVFNPSNTPCTISIESNSNQLSIQKISELKITVRNLTNNYAKELTIHALTFSKDGKTKAGVTFSKKIDIKPLQETFFIIGDKQAEPFKRTSTEEDIIMFFPSIIKMVAPSNKNISNIQNPILWMLDKNSLKSIAHYNLENIQISGTFYYGDQAKNNPADLWK